MPRFQLLGQIERRGEPVTHPFGQATEADSFQFAMHCGVDLSRWLRIVRLNLVEQLD